VETFQDSMLYTSIGGNGNLERVTISKFQTQINTRLTKYTGSIKPDTTT